MATKASTTQPRDSDQIRAFRKAAREAGCEDNEERFQDALRTVAKARPVEKGKKATSERD